MTKGEWGKRDRNWIRKGMWKWKRIGRDKKVRTGNCRSKGLGR